MASHHPLRITLDQSVSVGSLTSLTDHKSVKARENSKNTQIQGSITCPICYDDTFVVSNPALKTLECKHVFCKTCLQEYLKAKINSFQVLKIPCPYSGCQVALPDRTIKELLDKETYERYSNMVLQKVMNRNLNVKFCPKPGCSKQFKPSSKHLFTKCSCGTKICNICCNPWHEGKTCIEAIDPDFELYSQNENIRFCVMCKSHVQRVQGCHHITCPVCDYEWCWECGQEFVKQHPLFCPKVWSPAPPSVITKAGVKSKLIAIWKKSSKLGKAFLLLGLLLIIPFILVLLPFSWPLWICFEPGKDLDRRRPFASICVLIFCFIVGALYSPFVIPMLAVVLIVVLFKTIYFAVKKFCKKRKEKLQIQPEPVGVTVTIAPKRWTSGNIKTFSYTPNSRPENMERREPIAIIPRAVVTQEDEVLSRKEGRQTTFSKFRTRASLENIPEENETNRILKGGSIEIDLQTGLYY